MLDVYVYGSGECDQLGILINNVGQGEDDVLESNKPILVRNLNSDINNKVFKICCGGMHTLVLTTMGRIYSWGNNDDFALGREGTDNIPGHITTIDIPVNNISAGDSHSVAYNTELNELYLWGSYRVRYCLN